ncbi:hypothetical protein M569_16379, partial [Genlisea aurea]
RSFRKFIEENLGKLPHFVIYALLEWLIIILLFIDGFLAFLSNEIAGFFELKIPCLLCTRIDHILVHRNPNFYYNDSICESHKRDISSLAFCHVHKKLSDIRSMCQGCLLSFSVEKDSEFDKYKSIVGIQHKDDGAEGVYDEKSGILRCSCCGEVLKSRSSSRYKRSFSVNIPTPAPSPRAHFLYDGNKGGGNKDLMSQIMYTELKLMSGAESELPENDDHHDDAETTSAIPLSLDSEELTEDVQRTPIFAKGNKFFRIPLSDSAQASPRFYNRTLANHHLSINRKLDFICMEANDGSDMDGDSLRSQIHFYRKSLMALYMELDEERSASAVAAKNAMAMITRLQAEKAAVQMDALQYQRMMEEQAEYDQEALQVMKDLVLRREEDLMALESENEVYRHRYGEINVISSEVNDSDEDYYHDLKSQACSSSSFSSGGADQQNEHIGYSFEEPSSLEGQRTHLVSLVKELEGRLKAPPVEIFNSSRLFTGKEDEQEEVSVLRERIRSLEAERDFLKHVAMAAQQGDDGMKLLNEIAHHLRRLRQVVISLSDE